MPSGPRSAANTSPLAAGTIGPSAPDITTSPARIGWPRSAIVRASHHAATLDAGELPRCAITGCELGGWLVVDQAGAELAAVDGDVAVLLAAWPWPEVEAGRAAA